MQMNLALVSRIEKKKKRSKGELHKQRGLAGEPDERASQWKSVTGFCILDAEIQITENQKDGELV